DAFWLSDIFAITSFANWVALAERWSDCVIHGHGLVLAEASSADFALVTLAPPAGNEVTVVARRVEDASIAITSAVRAPRSAGRPLTSTSSSRCRNGTRVRVSASCTFVENPVSTFIEPAVGRKGPLSHSRRRQTIGPKRDTASRARARVGAATPSDDDGRSGSEVLVSARGTNALEAASGFRPENGARQASALRDRLCLARLQDGQSQHEGRRANRAWWLACREYGESQGQGPGPYHDL